MSIPKPIPVIIDALSARAGGGQTYVLHLAYTLSKSPDFEVYVIGNDSILEKLENLDVKRIHAPEGCRNPFIRFFWERLKLPQILKKIGQGIILYPNGLIPIQSVAGWKVMVVFQNMLTFNSEERKRYGVSYIRLRLYILEKMQLRSFRRADCLIVLSQYAKEVVAQKFNSSMPRVELISNSISPDFRNVISNSDKRPIESEYVLYVSTLDVYKAHKEVLHAWASFQNANYRDAKLVFIGSAYKPTLKKIMRLIDELRLHDSVIINTNVNHYELPAWYKFATLNLFASSCENGPFILLEALSAGNAVLCSDKPPMPEFGGNSVVYFNPYNVDELSKLIEKYMINENLRLEYGKLAYEKSKEFHLENNISITHRVFKAVAESMS